MIVTANGRFTHSYKDQLSVSGQKANADGIYSSSSDCIWRHYILFHESYGSSWLLENP